ncbi:hypothetical protein [Microbulbifer sp. JTAC008]|uniref:hypothetical protein n=1 Tax=unclassified Microbulbifer TaxID=2619833 RepID=UPI00403A31DA
MKVLNRERLNLIIALCAITISFASFYATYLQAKAANKQVKIMTMPVVKFHQGNFDASTQKPTIIFTLHNAGAGPAVLKTVDFTYKDKTHPSLDSLLKSCCQEEESELYQAIPKLEKEGENTLAAQSGLNKITLNQAIIAPQSSLTFLLLQKTAINEELWSKLNEIRNDIEVTLCVCSPLGDCYQSKGAQISSEIKSCPHNKK